MWSAHSASPARFAMREHGGILPDASLRSGTGTEGLLDFSVNVNPYGPAPAVAAAVRNAPLHAYPDPTARAARAALARYTAADPDGIVLGNGSAELLWTLAGVLLGPGDTVLGVGPTFSEFAAAAIRRGAAVTEWRASEANGFAVDMAAVASAVERSGAKAVYLCTPNNPTGAAIPAAEVAALAESCRRVTFALDEAFIGLSERHADKDVPLPANVVRVRSLTKEHAIPGVRAGYLLTTPPLAAEMEACRPPWTTGAAAQAAAVAACGAYEFVAASRQRLMADRADLAGRLTALGLRPAPSVTSFVLVRVKDGPRMQRGLLERHGILVRECASFGLPHYLRLAARPLPDQERLARAIEAEMNP